MRNWKYFKLIISTGFFLLLCPSLVTEKIQISSTAIAQQTTKYSDKTTFRWRDRLTQNNLEIEAQQLDEKATQQFQNGELEAALETWQKVLEIRNQLGDRVAISRTLNEIAVIYDTQGKYSQSLEFYQEALKIAQQEKDSANISEILSNMGLVYSQLGQYEQAINFYQQVLKTKPSTKATILNNIGAVYRHLKEFPKALDFYQQALAIHRKNQDHLGIATTLDNIGVIYREQGKKSQALESHQEALIIRKKLGDKEGQGATLHHIGIVHRESDRHQDALQFLTHTLIIDRQLGNQDGERITLANIGKLLEKKNHPQLAIIFYKQSVNITENIRKDLKKLPAEQQKSYVESVAEIYRTLADLLLQEKRAIEAHHILDLLKAQEIFEYMGNLKYDEDEYTEIPLLELEKKFWEMYTQLMNEVGTSQVDNQNVSPEKLIDIHNFIDSKEVTKIVSELEKNAKSQQLTPDMLLSLKYELQEHQEQNTVVLYPLLLEDRLELILVSANSDPIHRTVSVTKEEFHQAILELRVRLTNRNKAQLFSRGNKNQPDQRVIKAGSKLYNWLIKPIESYLKVNNTKTIVYAPDGQLRYVPLAALYDGEKWLIEKFNINNITAASLMDLTPKAEINPLVLAGALTEGIYNFQVGKKNFDFEGLPFAGVEVEKLATMFPETNKLLGNAFTKKAMESQMDNYNIVHFATHSAFVNGHPEESFILFGDGSRASLRDVKDWDLRNVELVVLSACQTGVGKQLGNGVEILGFGYQIKEAGASATLATLWRVDDQGTHEFMNDFYAALKNGATKSEAVQKAQITMINSEFSHPYYWAPFILIGNGF